MRGSKRGTTYSLGPEEIDGRGGHKRDKVAVLCRHEGAEHLGDNNAAAILKVANLEVLEDAADVAGSRAQRAVEHVDVLDLLVELLRLPKADLCG